MEQRRRRTGEYIKDIVFMVFNTEYAYTCLSQNIWPEKFNILNLRNENSFGFFMYEI